jgi:hypothetical protein
MKMPGFSAEASLKMDFNRYGFLKEYARGTDSQLVVPQRIKLRTVHCDCDPQTDICVCDNGRVIHQVLGDVY